MKTRIRKLYSKWVVEFPFKVVVYCSTFESALAAFDERDTFYANRYQGDLL